MSSLTNAYLLKKNAVAQSFIKIGARYGIVSDSVANNACLLCSLSSLCPA